MTMLELLQVAGVGALLGAVGQAMRAIVGLKKAHDDTAAARAAGLPDPRGAAFSLTFLLVTLLTGAVAGILAALVLGLTPAVIDKPSILALIAAGYAGTDAIEGFVRRLGPPAGDKP